MVRYRYRRFRRNLFRYILLLIISVLSVAGIYYKNNILQLWHNVSNTFIDLTGARIKTIIVIGASPKVEKLIIEKLGIKPGDSIFKLSTTTLLKNLINIG